jgi:hypothetical protein
MRYGKAVMFLASVLALRRVLSRGKRPELVPGERSGDSRFVDTEPASHELSADDAARVVGGCKSPGEDPS